MRQRLAAWCWILTLGTGAVSARAQPEGGWREYAGLPIVAVHVTSREIFDTPSAERNLFYGWANALHIRTRASVIERELLFSEGHAFDTLLVAESARNLRRLGIFQDVAVHVSRRGPGVAVHVVTDDQWSTRLIADISREGNILRLRLGLEDTNFLGRAHQLGGSIVASNDLNAAGFGLRDPRLFGSRWDGRLRYAADDLAILNEVRLERPYYSELVRSTTELDYRSFRGERRIFAPGGGTRDTLDVDETFGEAFFALHGHGTTRSRLGVQLSRRQVSGDVQADQASVALIGGWLRRAFRPLRNIDRYDVVEDVGSGWTLQVGAGADVPALGGERLRPFWRADLGGATFLGRSTLIAIAARHHGFASHGRLENARLAAEAWGFWKQTDAGLLAWNVGYVSVVREPEYLQLTVGGDRWLRGYGARHGVGTQAFFASVEERLLTNLHLLFLRFGVAVFVDAAQAWGPERGPRWDALDVGAGFGLRVGNRKSGAGVSRLDFAFGRSNFEVSLSGGSFFRAARDLTYGTASLFR